MSQIEKTEGISLLLKALSMLSDEGISLCTSYDSETVEEAVSRHEEYGQDVLTIETADHQSLVLVRAKVKPNAE